MKKSINLLFCIFSISVFSQTDGLTITLESGSLDPNMFGGIWSYGADNTEKDKMTSIFLWVKIDGFSENNPINFNNFSLVEHENKLRQRPYEVAFRRWVLSKCNLDVIPEDDCFIKYNLPGIENYDHYYSEKLSGFHKTTNSRQRFYLLSIPEEKNKKKKFQLKFPIKVRKKGEFTLYYKDQPIKTFTATTTFKKL